MLLPDRESKSAMPAVASNSNSAAAVVVVA
jgi:hypothetical protein